MREEGRRVNEKHRKRMRGAVSNKLGNKRKEEDKSEAIKESRTVKMSNKRRRKKKN